MYRYIHFFMLDITSSVMYPSDSFVNFIQRIRRVIDAVVKKIHSVMLLKLRKRGD